ncbi:MAG: hypothetical protein KDK48_06635, partial [Chlamydiia bacterium]|nr:hypothetical protein [Chlamydiia bacterium]
NEDIEKVNEYLRQAAEVGDGEGLYYRISLNLSQYNLEPDPVFLEYFWEDLENLLALDNSEGEQTDALLSCLDLIDLFTLTNREDWPKGVDDDKIAKVKERIASLED